MSDAHAKEGPDKKVWSSVMMVGSLLIGVIVMILIATTLASMALNSFNDGMHNLAYGMRQSANVAIETNVSVGLMFGGWFGVFIKFMMYAVGIAGTGVLFQWIMGSFDKKKAEISAANKPAQAAASKPAGGGESKAPAAGGHDEKHH